MERKPVKAGLDYIRNKAWEPKVLTYKGTMRYAKSQMPADLKQAGFNPVVMDCGEYWRISYGK